MAGSVSKTFHQLLPSGGWLGRESDGAGTQSGDSAVRGVIISRSLLSAFPCISKPVVSRPHTGGVCVIDLQVEYP